MTTERKHGTFCKNPLLEILAFLSTSIIQRQLVELYMSLDVTSQAGPSSIPASCPPITDHPSCLTASTAVKGPLRHYTEVHSLCGRDYNILKV